MTAFARIIKTGRNSTMPRIVQLPYGVGVDGTVFKQRVTLKIDEELCPDCDGHGDIECAGINPSTRPIFELCERCMGRGIITVELDEQPETVAASRCLPAATVGRSDLRVVESERPPHSGIMPASRATGDLSRTKLKTRTVLRSVHQHPASHSPASVNAPARAPGTSTFDVIVDGATVFAGMIVFSAIAWFFLVLA